MFKMKKLSYNKSKIIFIKKNKLIKKNKKGFGMLKSRDFKKEDELDTEL